MAFLDNAGDIILDAVLTDAGRQRLARGNFKIVKFALGDEEINYELFNNSHPSGSAFYDLEIMQTPILEAFTNNTSLMKSKLVSINRNNILYMPVLKVNDKSAAGHQKPANFDGYFLTADEKTSKSGNEGDPAQIKAGIMHGVKSFANGDDTKYICIDQGIVTDGTTDGLSVVDRIPADMMETAFLVKVDHRLLRLHAYDAANAGAGYTSRELINQFVDDDAVATYFFAMGDETNTVFGDRAANNVLERGTAHGGRQFYEAGNDAAEIETQRAANEMFKGPLGSVLRIVPKAAQPVQFSSTLFDKIGTDAEDETIQITDDDANGITYKYIDTSINITGVTTGYSIDLPIRIIKSK
tara:strand:+ start:5387 stop:6451 length:1065 start_codon:yes stop_codon:yes gene_type:complete